MTNDKFIQGRQQSSMTEIIQQIRRLSQDQKPTPIANTEKLNQDRLRSSLQRLCSISSRLLLRTSLSHLKLRTKAMSRLKKLLNRRTQEDKLLKMTNLKHAYVRMIKNCIFQNKFERFLERAHQRLLEKSFDKIKENNWIIEERKEILESILLKSYLKEALRKLNRNMKYQRAFEMMEQITVNNLSFQLKSHYLLKWQQLQRQSKKQDQKSMLVLKVIEN